MGVEVSEKLAMVQLNVEQRRTALILRKTFQVSFVLIMLLCKGRL